MKTSKSKKTILGLVGPICAGKETVGSYLQNTLKAKAFSLSDEIRQELKLAGFVDPSRETLQAVGNILRRIYGPGVLAERSAKKLSKAKSSLVIVLSIRNPSEAAFLQVEVPNLHLVNIDADKKIRFERMISRGRPGDPKTWEGFVKAEEKEFDHNKDKYQMQVNIAAKRADFTLENNGSFEDLFDQVDKLIKRLTK